MRVSRQSPASDHFILELDVCQLVFQFQWIRALDHLCGQSKGQLKHEVVVKSLGVEDAMVGQDLVIQSDSAFCSVNLVKLVFCGDTRGFLVPPRLSGSCRGPRSECPRVACCPAPPARGKGPPRS